MKLQHYSNSKGYTMYHVVVDSDETPDPLDKKSLRCIVCGAEVVVDGQDSVVEPQTPVEGPPNP